MEQAIRNFAAQFVYEPVIENKENLKSASRYVLMGMGGSHLAADILKNVMPDIPLRVHKDYGLPRVLERDIAETLFIASSYSGNTEEVISGLEEAFEKKYNIICIAVGGKLIEFAKTNNLPYIQLPNVGIQPRSALGYSMMALSAVIPNEHFRNSLKSLTTLLHPDALETAGKNLARTISGSVPVIYASDKNRSIAYNWKIKFNETGKIPAFYNVFPELNHNEMTGFDIVKDTKELIRKFYCIFIHDPEDHPQVQKRMKVCKELYEERGVRCFDIELAGAHRAEKIFNSLLLADWTAYNTAIIDGAEPEQVPMVEAFKRKIE